MVHRKRLPVSNKLYCYMCLICTISSTQDHNIFLYSLFMDGFRHLHIHIHKVYILGVWKFQKKKWYREIEMYILILIVSQRNFTVNSTDFNEFPKTFKKSNDKLSSQPIPLYHSFFSFFFFLSHSHSLSLSLSYSLYLPLAIS